MLKDVKNNTRVVTATELRRNFTSVVKRIHKRHEHTVVKSQGVSVAVMLSMEEYEKLLRYERLAEFQKLARAIGKDVEKSGLTEEQLMDELEETKREVFRERYGSL